MAETFRRNKIIDIVKRFVWKREMLKMEINDPDFDGIKEILQGEMKAYDLVIKELIKEFDISKGELD
ncbi:MAG: hypothetical protein ABFD18_06170 [Syntrophomonas sp.]